jgi:deoxyadenosine/deoxycytidine kinase
MKLICIEGGISAGKSTLTEQLAKTIDALPMFEPVAENPYLNRYYENPKRYALDMQFYLLSTRFEMHDKAIRHIWNTGQSVVIDRSIYGDQIFARKNFIDGNIDDLGYMNYCKHREIMNRYLMVPHVMLFLDVSPDQCLARIKSRGRACEKVVPLAYLQGLHDLHRELKLEMESKGSKVISIDWQNFGNVATVAKLVTS